MEAIREVFAERVSAIPVSFLSVPIVVVNVWAEI